MENLAEWKFSESFFAGFYLKKFPIVTGNPIYLVYGQRLNNNFSANRAFRLYDDLSPHVEGKRPTELLYDLANRFGFDVNIAGAIDRFFFQHSYMTDLGGGASPNVILTSNDPYLFEAIFFKTRVKEKMRVEYSLAFALNISRYIAWLNTHETDKFG